MDLDRIESLLKLMRSYDVSELRFEDADVKLSLKLGGVAAPTQSAPVALAAPLPAAAARSIDPVVEPGHVISSPMVGTFYRSPSPTAPAFVSVGDRVRKGQVLCIVEAMKLMNELECDVDGTITDILVDNASPVQFGQGLFRVRAG